mgnify:CR=1 FL=1
MNLETQNLIFVDLNCILHANAVVLSEWHKFFGNVVKSHFYRDIANKLLFAIDKVSTTKITVGNRGLQHNENFVH